MEQDKNNITDLLNVIEQIIEVLKEKYEATKSEEYKEELDSYLIKYNRICIKKEYENWEAAKKLPDDLKIEYYEKLASLISKEPIINKKEIILGTEKYIINGDYERLFKSCYKNVSKIKRKELKKELISRQKNIKFNECYFSLDYYDATITIKEKLEYCKNILKSIDQQPIEREIEVCINGEKKIIDEKFLIPYTIAATLEPKLENLRKREKSLQGKTRAVQKSVVNYYTTKPQEYINNLKEAKNELLKNIKEINDRLVEVASKVIEAINNRTNKRIVIEDYQINDKKQQDTEIVYPINYQLGLDGLEVTDSKTLENSSKFNDMQPKNSTIENNSEINDMQPKDSTIENVILTPDSDKEEAYVDEKEEILKFYKYYIFECSEKYDVDQELIMTILYKTLEDLEKSEEFDSVKMHYNLTQIINKEEPLQIKTQKINKKDILNNPYNFIENIAYCFSNIKNIYRNIADDDYKELFKAYSGWTNGYANYNGIGLCANYANECMKILEINFGYDPINKRR